MKLREQLIAAGQQNIIVLFVQPQVVPFVDVAIADRRLNHAVDVIFYDVCDQSGMERHVGSSDAKDFEVKKIFLLNPSHLVV